MIVCMCANVSDEVVLEYIRQGMSLADIQRDTNVANGCGVCRKTIREMIGEKRREDNIGRQSNDNGL